MITPPSTYQVGDIVERLISRPGKNTLRAWRRVVIEEVYERDTVRNGVLLLLTRRVGRTSDGRRYGVLLARADTVRPTVDHAGANVFADWLEDNNFPEAAAALRRAFPLGPPRAEAPAGAVSR